jgi:flagellar biosynthesis chaperone FliJ
LAEREAARARVADERRQQKQNDEFSTQSFLRLASKT